MRPSPRLFGPRWGCSRDWTVDVGSRRRVPISLVLFLHPQHCHGPAPLLAMEAPPSQPSDSGATSKTCSGLPSSGLGTLSIHDRARRRPRSRVIVEPLFWTKLQLDLLRCTFRGPFPEPPAIMKLNYPGDACRQGLFERYFRGGYYDREAAVRGLLGESEVPLQWSLDLYFCLGGYLSILLPCSYFCLRSECEGDSNRSTAPIAAHIDRSHIAEMRRNKLIRTIPDRYDIPPGAGIMVKIRLRKLISTEPLHEP